jgi:hypothetical protein
MDLCTLNGWSKTESSLEAALSALALLSSDAYARHHGDLKDETRVGMEYSKHQSHTCHATYISVFLVK